MKGLSEKAKKTMFILLKAVLAGVLLTSMAACNNDPVSQDAIDSAKGYSDVDVNMTVGEPAPDFSSTDANGNAISLSQYQNQSNVMLIFYRGNWCPFCVSHLDDIQNLFPILKDHNVQLLALSPDDAEASQKLAEKFDQPYVFVSDPGLAITDLYGVRRDEELPHPAVVLINKAGDIVWFYAGENYRERPSAEQLQQVIEKHL